MGPNWCTYHRYLYIYIERERILQHYTVSVELALTPIRLKNKSQKVTHEMWMSTKKEASNSRNGSYVLV